MGTFTDHTWIDRLEPCVAAIGVGEFQFRHIIDAIASGTAHLESRLLGLIRSKFEQAAQQWQIADAEFAGKFRHDIFQISKQEQHLIVGVGFHPGAGVQALDPNFVE